jgi:DNA-binding CsgD family transcriptional regulator
MTEVIVGRDAELASLRDFVESVSGGAIALVLEGEAGMGKTTLWRYGVETAETAGLCVLEAQPAESETSLSFSGLGDLLDPVLEEALAPLAVGQRSALARALVLEDVDGPAPDAHTAGVALLNALRGLCGSRDVLVAVDDAQWLDAASAAALAYATRRLKAERVGLLFSRRAGLESTLLDDLRRTRRRSEVEVGPLDAAALHQVVQGHLGVALPRPLLREVHQASGGNPFYALEIVRMLRRSDVSIEAGQPIPVPDSLHDLVHGRLLSLPPESRDFLLAAAAHAHPTLSITEAASGVPRVGGVTPALEARIVEVDGDRIRFTHPLLAAGAYEIADPLRRREIHARLADALEDPEARAWQLAASVDRADEAVAEALEDAARIARARGAPRPAALLLDRAEELTPADQREDAVRRAVDAAHLHYESGDSHRAETRLRSVIVQLPEGRTRARAIVRLARVRAYEALPEAVDLFLQAVDEAEGDREILAVAHEGVATCLWRLFERLDEALEHADLAAQLALELGNDALAGEALGTRLVAELLLGRESAPATAQEALALQPAAEHLRVLAQPRSSVAMDYLGWLGELERARDEMLALLGRARELGDESSPPFLLGHLSLAECDLGELEQARDRAVEGQDASEQAGQRAILAFTFAAQSLAEAQLGREEIARIAARRALELVPETGGRQAELVVTRALAHLEHSLGDAMATVERVEPALAFVRREAIAEPCEIPFVVDYVEALIELGRREDAIDLLEWYEGNARRLERLSALANCGRCRGLLAAQAGELDSALAFFAQALDLHEQVAIPLDRGRTLLALGATQRRAKRRREARATLEEALEMFEDAGAALWAERARAELARISGRAATPGALTPAEERVAALVAEGKTNREVAAALFLSDRTVEGHLTHVFGKLGIKHRSEVGPALAARQTSGVGAPNTGDSPVSAGPSAP